MMIVRVISLACLVALFTTQSNGQGPTEPDISTSGWTCNVLLDANPIRYKCQNCSFELNFGADQVPCPADSSIFKSQSICEIATGCGPIKWQCAENADRKCNYCNQTAGSDRPCNNAAELFMTEVDCEVGSDKCGKTCKPNEVFSSCATCEPTCADPTTLECSPWTCRPDCVCQPGYFRQGTECVKAESCPDIAGKQCFNVVLRSYKENFATISADRWPHSQPFFVPQCNREGHFNTIQCSDREGECLCVDPLTGEPRPETKRKIDDGLPLCKENIVSLPPLLPPIPPTPPCPPNEYFAECASSTCEPTCKQPNPIVCTDDCISTCTCKLGYFRKEGGACVPGSECEAKTDCHRDLFAAIKPAEELAVGAFIPNCAQDGKYDVMQCRGSTGYCWCADAETGKEIAGTRRGPTEENFDCDAIVIAPHGTENAGQKCAENEEYRECESSSCQPTCNNPTPIACTRDCVTACFCKPGYFRHTNGKCVAGSGCTAKTECHKQVFKVDPTKPQLLGAPKPPTCQPDGKFQERQCHSNGFCWCVNQITGEEIEGTRAGPGLFKDCSARKKDSEGNCGENEEYDDCVTSCQSNCRNPSPAVCDLKCNSGCRCKFSFLRNDEGTCVPASDCPTPTTECVRQGLERLTSVAEEAVPPVDFTLSPCTDEGKFWSYQCTSVGCFCIDPDTGSQVGPPSQGPPAECFGEKIVLQKPHEPVVVLAARTDRLQCGPNSEFQECGTACPQTCESNGPSPCIAVCKPACVCKDGYLLHRDQCIRPDKCPAVKIPQDVYSWQCNEETGEGCIRCNVDKDECDMTLPRFDYRETCEMQGCSRNCSSNEEFRECGSACPQTCAVPSVQACTRQCVAGCYCKVGYFRDPSGECVVPDDCPEKSKCVTNFFEAYKSARNALGRYMPKCKQSGEYELSQCHASTGHCWCVDRETGEEIEGTRKGPAESRVDCEKSEPPIKSLLMLNEQSKPTLAEDCTSNEEFNLCGPSREGGCGEPSCSNKSPDSCRPVCAQGCFCKPNYYRHAGGGCVEEKQCGINASVLSSIDTKPQQKSCGTNEELQSCGTACEPSCDKPAISICNAICLNDVCQCKRGYFRHGDGSCVRASQCEAKTVCHKMVFDAFKSGAPPPGRRVPQCQEDGSFNLLQCHGSTGYCWCVDGATGAEIDGTRKGPGGGARPDCSNTGVSPTPEGNIIECLENEEFKKCGTACEPSCVKPQVGPCVKLCKLNVCQCKSGYFRNGLGKCVSAPSCLTEVTSDCHKEVLEAFREGLPRPGQMLVTCTDQGLYEAVQCHRSTGFCWCVAQNTGEEIEGTRKGPGEGQPECSTAAVSQIAEPQGGNCTATERFLECGDPCEPTCGNPSPHACAGNCNPGCVCKTGYFRHTNGQCVEGKMCQPKGPCHTQVFATAQPKLAGLVGTFVPKCTTNGTFWHTQCHGSSGQCWCVEMATGVEIEGTRRGPGVGQIDCAARQANVASKCVKNEIFKECGTACENKCDDIGNPQPKICTLQCVIGCQCVEGFYRDADGRCVSEQECKAAKKCPTNEVFKECGSACEPSCDNPYSAICTFQCVFGCQCKLGFYRGPEGSCVSADKCTPKGECHKKLFDAFSDNQLAPGEYVPSCNSNGAFQIKQCHGSTGYCWCVEEGTGKEIEGTKRGPGTGRVDCTNLPASSLVKSGPSTVQLKQSEVRRINTPVNSNSATSGNENCKTATDSHPEYCNSLLKWSKPEVFCGLQGFKPTCAKTCCGISLN